MSNVLHTLANCELFFKRTCAKRVTHTYMFCTELLCVATVTDTHVCCLCVGVCKQCLHNNGNFS